MDYQPAPEIIIDNLETLKVATDPKRLEIVKVFHAEDKPLSVKQIAEKLEVDPRNLYYHIKLLEEHGLLVVVDTKIVSNIAEKYYHLVAYLWRIDHFILSPEASRTAFEITANTILDDTRAEIRNALHQGLIQPYIKDSPLKMTRTGVKLTPEQFAEVKQRLEDFLTYVQNLKETETDAHADADAQTYTLAVLLYPSTYKTDDTEETP